MRIIAGRLRRRTLETNPGNTTRPITDRAKVKLFDHLVKLIPGAKVADVFCGTGTMGFESISRGAISCVFYEMDHRAHDLLVKNAEKLGVAEQSVCWRVDVFRCSFKPKGETTDWYPYDLIFFDPPYPLLKNLTPGKPLYKALERLAKPEISAENVTLVLRYPEHSEFTIPPVWQPFKELRVGSMRMRLLSKGTPETPFTSELVDDSDEPAGEDSGPEDSNGDGPAATESDA